MDLSYIRSMNITRRVFKKIKALKKKSATKHLSGRLHFDIGNAILISGMPRGGSTWLSEIVRTLPGSAVLWEPLHLYFDQKFNDLNFKWRQYLDKNNDDKIIYQTFQELLQGNSPTNDIMKRTDVSTLVNADFLIIKFCRANRLLPYLNSNFKFKKVIHLLRHPCAVISSQLKFSAWDQMDKTFTEDELKPDGFVEKYDHILKKIASPEEKLAAVWCLNNIIPLTQNDNNQWVTFYYENLLLSHEKELGKLNLNFPESTLDKITNPSSTFRQGSSIKDQNNVKDQFSYWKKTFINQQIPSILTILNEFKYSCV